jgi:simple sugar transport system ATP-binding protein
MSGDLPAASQPPEPGAGPAMLEVSGIRKSFGLIEALKAVDLTCVRGEVHALLGENGAGKTTLMNIIGGLMAPDSGEMLIGGSRYKPASVKHAIQCGIGVVHQEYRLVPRLSVAENLFLGFDRAPQVASASKLGHQAARVIEQYGFRLDPAAKVSGLSIGEQQRLAILRTLVRGASVLILDEPTAALTPQEADALFGIIRGLAGEGKSVIFISHKLREVLEVSSRVSVLRAGRCVATHNVSECDERSLAREMLGHDVQLPSRGKGAGQGSAAPVLEVRDLCVRNDLGLLAVDEVSFALRPGEIAGLAGVAGNGQRELSEALAGVRAPSTGRVVVGGADLSGRDSAAFSRAGVGYIPEDRLGMGTMPRQSIALNSIMKAMHVAEDRKQFTRGPWLRPGKIEKYAKGLLDEGQVSTRDPKSLVGNLSGGNVQRFLIARELRAARQLLVAVHPTRGLDIGATERTWRLLLRARDRGVGVVLISEDLDEILSLSDRILVMNGGRVAGEIDNTREAPSREEIGLLMGGASGPAGVGGAVSSPSEAAR